ANAPPTPPMSSPDTTRHVDAATRTREATRPPPLRTLRTHFDACDECRTIRRPHLLMDRTTGIPTHSTGRPGDGDSVVLRHRRHEWPKCRRDDREAAGMGLFKRRKSRAT